ncbi:hypothetical protein E2493_03280 [Sphingomonas parva]|uniref:Uncharacterized protein n=1 Tax=Sphingomonas parva TaxID=2555898 RepID=A0A4Y8ZWU5_9SPHN|nr:hypothetical protein [Sphingomonas parva]TFI59655.1 hypothetical protein E2493_03280 [Sphingomonas parva]
MAQGGIVIFALLVRTCVRLRRCRMAGIASLVAVSGLVAASSAAEAQSSRSDSASVRRMLAGAAMSEVDRDGGIIGRRVIRGATLERGCNLVLRTDARPEFTVTMDLGDLHFVQGDDRAMIDIATRREPATELILSVGPARYGEAMGRLASLARSCGAELVGPPPLVSTAR